MKRIFLFIGLCICLAFNTAFAQLTLLSTYGLTSDTTINSGTSYLTVRNPGGKATTTVQVTATKISGLVAGTISLLGSLDGINFKVYTLSEAATAGHTFTATDVASQTFIWRLEGNPYIHWRVSWTGAGTMSAKFTAKVLSH